MGGFSWLARRPAAAGDSTHALFAAESHSIVDNLVALFERSRAWNCSNQERALDQNCSWYPSNQFAFAATAANASFALMSRAMPTTISSSGAVPPWNCSAERPHDLR